MLESRNNVASARRGRPPRDAVDILRTKLWCRAVLLESGLASAYALELRLSPGSVRRGTSGLIVRPRKWDAYLAGRRVPQRMPGKDFAIDVAEAHYPGTAAVFESPMWDVLKGRPLAPGKLLEHGLALTQTARMSLRLILRSLRNDSPAEAAEWVATLRGIDALFLMLFLLSGCDGDDQLSRCVVLAARKLGTINDPYLKPFRIEIYAILQDRHPRLFVSPKSVQSSAVRKRA